MKLVTNPGPFVPLPGFIVSELMAAGKIVFVSTWAADALAEELHAINVNLTWVELFIETGEDPIQYDHPIERIGRIRRAWMFLKWWFAEVAQCLL